MKDLPHHIKKLNRQVIRSIHREEMEGENVDANMPSPPSPIRSIGEEKKLEKERKRQERLGRAPIHLTEEERNRKMKERVPVFDRNNAKPKMAKPTRKKTPRI